MIHQVLKNLNELIIKIYYYKPHHRKGKLCFSYGPYSFKDFHFILLNGRVTKSSLLTKPYFVLFNGRNEDVSCDW